MFFFDRSGETASSTDFSSSASQRFFLFASSRLEANAMTSLSSFQATHLPRHRNRRLPRRLLSDILIDAQIVPEVVRMRLSGESRLLSSPFFLATFPLLPHSLTLSSPLLGQFPAAEGAEEVLKPARRFFPTLSPFLLDFTNSLAILSSLFFHFTNPFHPHTPMDSLTSHFPTQSSCLAPTHLCFA